MADAKERGCHVKGDKLGKRQRYKSDCDHVLKKRLPPRLPRRSNDIYVTNKSNYQVCMYVILPLIRELSIVTDGFCHNLLFIDRVSYLAVRNC
jgi:hypothetical protein